MPDLSYMVDCVCTTTPFLKASLGRLADDPQGFIGNDITQAYCHSDWSLGVRNQVIATRLAELLSAVFQRCLMIIYFYLITRPMDICTRRLRLTT